MAGKRTFLAIFVASMALLGWFLTPYQDGCALLDEDYVGEPSGGFGYDSTPLGTWTTELPDEMFYVIQEWDRQHFHAQALVERGPKLLENSDGFVYQAMVACTSNLAAKRRVARMSAGLDLMLITDEDWQYAIHTLAEPIAYNR